ncbi:MAG: 2-dehydro-3-deoxygalactonokinase [Winogradskyella sp.]|uniref:2-dehydro-3-deoxygalactonokinase n=1 Tax=Winogradskyella sp. TaxID=1883156 RepID=UPI003859B5C7
MPEYFISCDWGTSNFRLRLVKTDSLAVIFESVSAKGIKILHNDYLQQTKFNQYQFFCNYLISQIKLLPKPYQNYRVVASGMVTANIGLHELDYALMPFRNNGSTLLTKKIIVNNVLEVLLVSGVRNDFGMMRGEETQVIGLSDEIQKITSEGILLLPGTHSKHLTYKNGTFTELKSYMTGELFEILSQKSILANSIFKDAKDTLIEDAFFKGLKKGVKGELTSSLFSIRASDLLGLSKKEENYYFLSGLIIGDELSYLKNEDKMVFLASPEPLSLLYKMALEHILKSNNYNVFNRETSEKAILLGQQKILKLYG